MQIRYFDTAWNDVKNTPGWFGKICLLALVNFIPIFGSMVTYGYLYGWAREISWGAHRPMPNKLIYNDDGKYWRRGWFALVLTFVFSLIPTIVVYAGQTMRLSGLYLADSQAGLDASSAIGLVLYLAGMAATLFVGILAWIGCMRVSIYDRLSAGFQFGTLWKMFRKDTNGIMRIFGMSLLVSLIIGIILSIIITVFLFMFMFAGVAGVMSSGYTFDSSFYMTDAQAAELFFRLVSSAGLVGFVCLLLTGFFVNLGSVFVDALVIRAMGYWTMQFDVPRWRGQDDPLPFEMDAQMSQPQPQPYQQGGYQAQPQAQPAQSPAWSQPVQTQDAAVSSGVASGLGAVGTPMASGAPYEGSQSYIPAESADGAALPEAQVPPEGQVLANGPFESAMQSVQEAQDAAAVQMAGASEAPTSDAFSDFDEGNARVD